MPEPTLEDLHAAVRRHPIFVGYKMDGQDLRICPAEGDLYVGVPNQKQGITLQDGGIVLVNPDREDFDCTAPQAAPLLLTDPRFLASRVLLSRALKTLDFAQAHPDMILTNAQAQEAFGRWIVFLTDRRSLQAGAPSEVIDELKE